MFGVCVLGLNIILYEDYHFVELGDNNLSLNVLGSIDRLIGYLNSRKSDFCK